jgi:hypothetical protein
MSYLKLLTITVLTFLRQVEHIPAWSFVTQIFHKGQPSRGGDHKTSEVMTST